MAEASLQRGRKIVPGLTVALILILAVLAFRNGFSLLSPTGLVALDNSSFSGTFNITDTTVTIPAEHSVVKVSAPEPARIITRTDEINSSGNFEIADFVGIITSDGSTMQLVGDMESIGNGQFYVRFTTRESSTIILKAGSIEVISANASIFEKRLTGSIRLEDRWTIRLNETPVTLRGFKGSAHFQRVNNETTLMLNGNSENVRVEQENFIKNVA